MRILVTGGDGFVGRPLCHYLSLNHDVHILDNYKFGFDRNYYHQNQNITINQCDIREFNKVEEVISRVNPEILFHLAAIHYIPECEKTPHVAEGTNVIGTVNVLRALREGTRLIFVSSAAVYAPDSQPHREDISLLGPCDVYGLTKLHAEHYVNYFGRMKELGTTIVRLFNVIGPGETNPHVLPEIIAQLLNGKRVIRLGNIHSRRDYIYTLDSAEALAAIGLMDENSIKTGEVLNLGTSRHYSVAEMVTILSEIIGERIEVTIDPGRVRQTDRPVLCADMTKTTTLTDWKPRISMRDALEATWQNPDLRIPQLREAQL